MQPTGFEPVTTAMSRRCSTTELRLQKSHHIKLVLIDKTRFYCIIYNINTPVKTRGNYNMKLTICSFTEYGDGTRHAIIPAEVLKWCEKECENAFSNSITMSGRSGPFGGSTAKGSCVIKMPENMSNLIEDVFNKTSGGIKRTILEQLEYEGVSIKEALSSRGFDVTIGSTFNDAALAIYSYCPVFDKNRDAIKWCEDNGFEVDKEEYEFAIY